MKCSTPDFPVLHYHICETYMCNNNTSPTSRLDSAGESWMRAVWSPSWAKVPGSGQTAGETLNCSFEGSHYNSDSQTDTIISLHTKKQLFYNAVCFILWVTRHLRDGAGKRGLARQSGAQENSKTYSLSYLKCFQTCCACRQAWIPGSVQQVRSRSEACCPASEAWTRFPPF